MTMSIADVALMNEEVGVDTSPSLSGWFGLYVPSLQSLPALIK